MKVTICEDGKSAVTESGRIFIIQGLIIKRKHTAEPVFYSIKDRLCQLVCSPGTVHRAVPLSKRKINII